MTFDTHDIILPCGTNIATCHTRDLTYDNKNFLQKKIKKQFKN